MGCRRVLTFARRVAAIGAGPLVVLFSLPMADALQNVVCPVAQAGVHGQTR